MGAGHPTAYRPEYATQLAEFFNIQASDVDDEGKRVAKPLPTLAAFACKIGVHRETLLNWCDKFPEFFDAYKMAKEHQERILVENGLLGGYEKAFAIFTAKNLIDWRDKAELTGAGGGAIKTETTITMTPDEAYKRMLGG